MKGLTTARVGASLLGAMFRRLWSIQVLGFYWWVWLIFFTWMGLIVWGTVEYFQADPTPLFENDPGDPLEPFD